MKNIVVLGAGQSTPYLISFLLDNAEENNWFITICDRDYELAKKRLNGSQYGDAVEFDINDASLRKAYIQKADVIVNMLAPTFQYLIALDCLNHGTHCISTSYEDVRIQDLHKDALRKGILILNEMGLDPGIDHMTAMLIIDRVKENGGKISSFKSYGGGLPAPEAAASNPFKYCITWNPRNVVMAGEYGAQFMEAGKLKILPHHEVFNRTWRVYVEGLGEFEAYPNRDSLVYQKLFHLGKVRTMIRGTIRYPGWSEVWSQIVKLGMANESLRIPNLSNKRYNEFTEMFLPTEVSGANVEERTANYLNISPTGNIIDKMRWLGLFSDEKIEANVKTAAEVLTNLLKHKMPLPKGARDMVALKHEMIASYNGNNKERITSSLIEYSDIKGGFTAISKLVGLPAAISVKLLLTDKLPITGCRIPTHPAIYNPVLKELSDYGVSFNEKVEKI
jgi:saccharopine dehydrogenase-like NADP-dependent oxidoreductase